MPVVETSAGRGVSTSIATFRRGLCENGQHRCTLVVPRYGVGDPPDPGVHRVAARRVPMDPEDRLMSGRALDGALGGIDARGVDVVHIQTPFIAHSAGVRWARRHALPVVETWHTHFEEYFHHYVPFLPRRLLRVAARSVSRRQCNALDRIIVPSPAMEQVLRTHGIERPITVLTREIVLPGRGACAAPDDPAGFAAVVSSLMHDPDARAQMARAGPAFAAEWDTDVTARGLIAVYEALARGPDTSPADVVAARA